MGSRDVGGQEVGSRTVLPLIYVSLLTGIVCVWGGGCMCVCVRVYIHVYVRLFLLSCMDVFVWEIVRSIDRQLGKLMDREKDKTIEIR